mmetsp:Transcript_9460/g.27636  ORF Transcript_9460/g.27636 Transcript_9460/m.27636 type:complete len:266 (+) Transcript_9460:41-838(+)
MPTSSFARMMSMDPLSISFGRGEQHPVFHREGSTLVLAHPPTSLGPTSYATGKRPFETRGKASMSSSVRFASSFQEDVAPSPGPGYYDPYTSEFDRMSGGQRLLPYGAARRDFISKTRASFPNTDSLRPSPGGYSARASPYIKKDPVSMPSPFRYAALSRNDVHNIAGAPALLLERHDRDARTTACSTRASSLHNLTAKRMYGVGRAIVKATHPSEEMGRDALAKRERNTTATSRLLGTSASTGISPSTLLEQSLLQQSMIASKQ